MRRIYWNTLSLILLLTVSGQLKANSPIKVKNSCVNNLLYFSSEITSSDIISYYWDFGDASFSFDKDAFHAFHEDGNYDITLTVMNSKGEQIIYREQIEVFSAPFAFFSSNQECSAITTLSDNSISESELIKWQWFEGNNHISTNNEVSSKFLPGNKFITLMVSNSNGCVDTEEKIIQIKKQPKLSLESTTICTNQSNPIRIDFGIKQDEIQDFFFQIDNKSYKHSDLQRLQFTKPKKSNFNARIISTEGCIDSISTSINIIETPVKDFDISIEKGCAPHQLSLKAKQSGDEKWQWMINQNIVSEQSEISQKLDMPGVYNLELKVQSSNGCVYESPTKSIIVYPSPILSTYIEKKIINNRPTANVHSGEHGSIKHIDWGDGTIEEYTTGASHIYTDYGNYIITTKALNDWGCIDSILYPISFSDEEKIITSSLITPNGDGIDDEFKVFTEFNHEMELIIYDQLGREVYRSSNLDYGWKGYIGNQLGQNGVYLYQIKSADRNNLNYQGHFILQR